MERRSLFGANDFFPKDFTFGKAHSVACNCDVCLQSDQIFQELSTISQQITSHQVNAFDSKKICDLVDSELLDKLSCGNGDEFINLVENFNQVWQEQVQGHPVSSLQNCHQDSCNCMVCAAKNEVISKLDEICASKSVGNTEFFETINKIKQDDVKSYLVCEPQRPLIVTTTGDNTVHSIIDANTQEKIFTRDESLKEDKNVFQPHNEKVSSGGLDLMLKDLGVEDINLNDVVDICLCDPGNLSPYCLKHSVQYCQHMQTKLYEQGCTCTRDNECLFCQRLKCNYCSHERSLPRSCPHISDPITDDLTLMISSWLDDKLEEAGVSSDLIKQFTEPINQKKTNGDHVKPQDDDLPKLFANHLKRSVEEKEVWDCNPVDSDIFISDKMRDEILNMNQLFDIRPFPRCYRLKGVKSNEGVGYCGIDEEYMELGFETWKLPNQFPEDTLPVTAPLPDVEARMDKEDEIRKRAKNLRPSTSNIRVNVVGLSDEWRPLVTTTLDTSDYAEKYTLQQKQEWADKTYEEIMGKCYHLFESKEDRDSDGKPNQMWSKVQPILDKYGEESVPFKSETGLDFDLDTFLQDCSGYTKRILDKYQNSKTIGYKPEFWEGFEDWKPPKSENEVRKRLIDEVKKFSKELDMFKNDFERALSNRPGIEINAEETLNDLISPLPNKLKNKIERLKNELPEDWISDPDSALVELESVSLRAQVLKPKSSVTSSSIGEEKHRAERTVSECDSLQISDDDNEGGIGGMKETFCYDDEEQAEDMKKEDESSAFVKEVPSVSKRMDAILEEEDPFAVNSVSSNFACRPAPYVTKLKEEMLKNSSDGLHPTQKAWFDRPMFPYWTPSVLYDLSQIEKLFFEGVPEYSPEIDMSKLKEIEERLLNRKRVDIAEDLEQIIEEIPTAIVVDEPDTSAPRKEPRVEKTPKSAAKEGKKTKSEKKSKKSSKSASNEDCLIQEDDFKNAIEQLLAEAKKKETIKEKESSEGGALSLEQIKKGIAGRVKSLKEGAIELDCDCNIDLESVVPCPALKYNFKLDVFQKQAIIALEAGLSVFVAAHTSAGKTVAAEYAIAMALRNGCRVVYTSPIKALSNQKYNDFTKKFKGKMKVGIITGDVQLNKEAECLIMTTEILRSMLYNQSSILSDLEYVIFDEVHYFNDPERGNVWEEVLILLPHQCQLVMLSATVPNVMNFASWVGSLRKREVIVTMTNCRPVPLKHYIHFSTSPEYVSDALLIRKAEGPFLSDNFNKAIMLKKETVKPKGNAGLNAAKMWSSFIVNHLQKHNRLPTVVFCFSRKRCDELATQIKNVDLVKDPKKKHHIENFFNRQINMLQEEDRDIRQIVTMKGLLQKGIGVHHSGILPILKEIVEVLFSESQIKLLFATETFAMGVNMPAKTVVFQQVGKFDGIERRPLKPGEYTQMAGRAGRRGIDQSGTVIITEWNTKRERCVKKDDLCEMLTGSVDPLKSQFRLRYSMILTALKPEGENSIPSIIQKSFFDFSLKAQKNKTQEMTAKDDIELKRRKDVMATMPPALRDDLLNYCNIVHHFLIHHEYIREKMFAHSHFNMLFSPGRLVVVCYERYLNVYGVILNVDSGAKTYDIAVMTSSRSLIPKYFKEVYTMATEQDLNAWHKLIGFRKMELLPMSDVGTMDPNKPLEVISCKASHIYRIVMAPFHKLDKAQVNTIMETLRYGRYSNMQLEKLIGFLMKPAWDPHSINFLNEEEISFDKPDLQVDVLNYHKMWQVLKENLFNVSLPSNVQRPLPLLDCLAKCYWFLQKSREIDKRKVEAQKDELKSLFNDFDCKLKFLKRNKYIKEDSDVVDTKGRIASRMTNFEVFVTEILLKNVLEDLNGAETAALLSCLVIPGVNTDEVSPLTQPNPLFKPLFIPDVDNSAEHNISRDASKMSRHDLKKKLNEIGENRNKALKAEEEYNALIYEYLDIPESLKKAIDIVNDIRNDLITQEQDLEIEPMEGSELSKVSFYLVPIIYAWATGKPMKEIMQVLVPNIQEGILVRWVINLNETIKDIDSAIHHFLKDSRIKEKFETASNCIKRGIIDTPSLYLNQRSQTN